MWSNAGRQDWKSIRPIQMTIVDKIACQSWFDSASNARHVGYHDVVIPKRVPRTKRTTQCRRAWLDLIESPDYYNESTKVVGITLSLLNLVDTRQMSFAGNSRQKRTYWDISWIGVLHSDSMVGFLTKAVLRNFCCLLSWHMSRIGFTKIQKYTQLMFWEYKGNWPRVINIDIVNFGVATVF